VTTFSCNPVFATADFDGDGTPDCVTTTPLIPPDPLFSKVRLVFLKGLVTGGTPRPAS
jgi:hypothetical protein